MTRPLTEERRNLHDALCSLPSRREHRAEHATHAEIAGWREALRRAIDSCNIVLGEAEPPTMQAIADWRKAARDWRTRAEDAEAKLDLLVDGECDQAARPVDVRSLRRQIFDQELERLAPATLPSPEARESWAGAIAAEREACARIAELYSDMPRCGPVIATAIRGRDMRAASAPGEHPATAVTECDAGTVWHDSWHEYHLRPNVRLTPGRYRAMLVRLPDPAP